MLKKLIRFSAAITLAVMINSCGTDPVGPGPEPESKDAELKMNFKINFDGKAVDFNTNSFVTSSMDTIIPTKFKFIFSDMRFEKMDGTELTFPNRYGYVSFVENKTQLILPELPEGNYKAFRFLVGLDSITNHGDPAQWNPTHPLNVINNGLHWGWAGGYIFMAHEGAYRANGKEESYTFHIATLPFVNQINIPFAYNHLKGEDDVIQIDIDLSKYFDGVHAYSLQNDIAASHSAAVHAPYINKLRENIRGMFTAQQK